ncbi:unnamed protein product [Cylindrotheca closterium]|uniref:Uncharacterized protein n=1 Tax=Cylindrotheca closterium TaxID=2856 RepID=A0AAD2G9G8_9STRA|nr:unnamed protein product [Cylindrotheca closterium]
MASPSQAQFVQPTTTIPDGRHVEDYMQSSSSPPLASPNPPSPLNCLAIASIILCISGVGLGLAAGSYASASHAYNNGQEFDLLWAQLYGLLGIAAFATAIPLLACGASRYQNIRGSKGLPVMMIIAWIAYGLGMMGALILLGRSLFFGKVEVIWVYLAILYNVIPYYIMMGHAEHSRRR